MNTLGKIAFYVLFVAGAIRLFKGMKNLWPLLYNTTDKLPVASDGVQRRYYQFDNIETEPMDNSQVIILIISGLLMIGLAFYIRKKVDEKSVSN